MFRLKASGPKAGARRADAGFSLVELVMALFVLAFGVIGLATTTLFITRQLTLAEVTTSRVAAIQSVMERIRATPYDSIKAGGDTIRAAGGLLGSDRHHCADQVRPNRGRGSGSGLDIRDPVDSHAVKRRHGHGHVQGAETMKIRDRRGFTLVELMIVAVVGAMVIGSTYRILLSSQRALTVQTAQIQGQQNVRAGLDILFSEIREISCTEGDILTMGPDRIEIRAMRAFGLVCGTSPTGSPVRVQKVGRFFEDGDSVMVFADNDPDISRDDTIIAGVVGSIDRTQTCPGGDVAQSLAVPAFARKFPQRAEIDPH